MKVGQRGRILSQYSLKIEIESIFCYCQLTLIDDNTFIQMREKPRLFRAGMDSAAAIAVFSMSAGTSK